MLEFEVIAKYVLLVAAAPIWWPFMKAMWQELREIFEDDGGLFGEPPAPREREKLEAEKAKRPPKLVHEWLAHLRPSPAPSARRGAAQPPPQRGPTQRSFRR